MTSLAQRPNSPGEDSNATPIAAGSSRPPAGARGHIAIWVLAFLASIGAIYLAKSILIPIVLAWVGKIVLSPTLRRTQRMGIPRAVAALGIVVLALGAITAAALMLAEPAQAWFDDLPNSIDDLRQRIAEIAKPVEKMSKAAGSIVEGVEKAVQPDVAAVPVSMKSPGESMGMLFDGAQSVLAIGLAAAVLLLFMLLSDGAFLAKVMLSFPTLGQRKIAVRTLRSIESGIANYLTRIIVINLCLGVAIGVSLYLIGMPNPALWGTMAALLNFVPYLGALVGASIVGAAALLTYSDTSSALLPPAVYLCWNVLEGMIITPIVLGRALTMSPVVVFVWFLFWSWLWGIPGALLAVPLLAATKIACDAVPATQPIGRLLAR